MGGLGRTGTYLTPSSSIQEKKKKTLNSLLSICNNLPGIIPAGKP